MAMERTFTLLTGLASMVAGLMLSASAGANNSDSPIAIKVDKPVYVIPRFTGKFRQREVSVAPDEYELADRLRALLDEGNTQAVMDELAQFYDIELSVAMLMLKAQIYFSLEKHEDAEKAYKAALARQPHLVRAYADLAQLYMLTDRPLKAREHFANAVAFGASEAYIHGQLGYLNLTHFGPYAAISAYQQAIALEPENSQWQQGLLAALSQAGMFESAKALIADLLSVNPENGDLWLNKAAIAMQQDDVNDALASMEMALLLGDQDRQNLKSTVQLHLQAGSYNRAVELIKQDIALHELNMKVLNEYLSWLHQAEMHKEISTVLTSVQPRVNELNAEDKGLFYFHQGQALSADGQVQAADRAYQQALEQDPANGRALLVYAAFLQKQERYAKAEMLFMRAEGMQDFTKNALLGKAQLYIDMLDYRAALEALRQAYARYPELVGLKDNIEVIESIIRARNRD